MPKEKVWDDVGLFDIEVGWSGTGEYVQVGIITHDGRSLADWLNETSKKPVIVKMPDGTTRDISPPPTEAMASFNSLWSTLSRSQINRLIRVLRKARDDSYGKDE